MQLYRPMYFCGGKISERFSVSRTKDRTRARGEFPRLNISAETRAAFNELLVQAPKLGLDPERVEAAGLPGLRALLALKQAAESSSDRKRDVYLTQLQGTLRLLQYRKHPERVRQLQARAMALQGRGGDTEVAHVTVGEIVLPRALQTRAVLEALGQAAGAAGIPLAHLRVGSRRNSINPHTGQPEFFETPSDQNYCQLPDGRIVPYSDLGLGYAKVQEGGVGSNLGAGVGAGHAGANANWPTEEKPGGLAGGGKSGPYTSTLSRVLRNITDSARFTPLRPLTGTASVGGSIAKAFPVIGGGLMLLDYLKAKDDFENAPICKPVA